MEAKELHRSPDINCANWDTWVPKYLERHCESPRTHERYLDAWKWLSLWLMIKRYHSSRDISYRNAIEYVDWRTSYKKKTGRTVGRNTAILELKILAIREAPCRTYRQQLQAAGLIASMSRKGNCYDNAAMEAFWSTLKREAMAQSPSWSKDRVRRELFEYIEGT